MSLVSNLIENLPYSSYSWYLLKFSLYFNFEFIKIVNTSEVMYTLTVICRIRCILIIIVSELPEVDSRPLDV